MSLLILIACQTKEPNAITLDEVLSTFKHHQVPLKTTHVKNDEIFGMRLTGVRPTAFELDGKLLTVYIFNSQQQREMGLEDFYHKTALANIVSNKTYSVKNVLFFYVHGQNLSEKVEMADEIQQIVSELGKE